MSPFLKRIFNLEMEQAEFLLGLGDYLGAFRHFERAHILAQRYPMAHTRTHWGMLKIGLKTNDRKEVIGQLLRIPSGFIGSLLGIFPSGNTGGSNISAFKKLPIPSDLQKILDSDKD